MKLRIYKSSHLFATKDYVSNGHWLLPRYEFNSGKFRLEEYFQGVLDSGVEFKKEYGTNEIVIGEDADLPDLKSAISADRAVYEIELTPLVYNNKHAVIEVKDTGKVTLIDKGYAKILENDSWVCDNKLQIFQRKSLDIYDAVVMGIRIGSETEYIERIFKALK